MVDHPYIKEIKTINVCASIYYLLLLQDGRVASCSWSPTVKIINIEKEICELALSEHKDTVTHISQLPNGKLISCSRDKSIKIWTIDKTSYSLDHTIGEAHEDWILKIISLSHDRMATCSKDKRIKIWNSNKPYDLIAVLKGHQNIVSSIIQLRDRECLLSGSEDKTLRIWNLESYQCTFILSNMYYNRKSLLEIDNYIILACGNAIKLLNSNTFRLEKAVEDKITGTVWSMIELKGGNVLFGTSEGKLCLYDVKKNAIKIQADSIDGGVSSLMNLNENTFLSGSQVFSIKMWKY